MAEIVGGDRGGPESRDERTKLQCLGRARWRPPEARSEGLTNTFCLISSSLPGTEPPGSYPPNQQRKPSQRLNLSKE
uniref:Uncharacterized protein n=1 Tax=Ursus americanus TaxID=9643 RepID=A0A452QB29_URSAM